MITNPASRKSKNRTDDKRRTELKSSLSSSSSSCSDEELVVRRKNLPTGKTEPDGHHSTLERRHRRPSSRSSVERQRRRCHPHPSPHRCYTVQKTCSLDRSSHPHAHLATGWCQSPAGNWPTSVSPSPWLCPPPATAVYPAGPCPCHPPVVSLCQVVTQQQPIHQILQSS